jgi:bifunctional non-homologous end joining protein LigD
MVPQLATLRKEAPSGPGWLHEIKHDGYRLLCRVDTGKVSLTTRGQFNWAGRLPEIAAAIRALRVKSAWLDGELVALRPDGVSDFGSLQTAFRRKQTGQLVYYAFDLLHLDGRDLRPAPLVERKVILHRLLKGRPSSRLQYVDHVEGNGPEFFEQCRRMGLEGAVSKRADAPYLSGRSNSWLKVKCRQRGHFVIAGYVESSSRHRGIRGLVLGTYGPDGTLRYDGRVGSGLSARIEAELLQILRALSTDRCPFAKRPPRDGARRFHWTRPELVAVVDFTEWTSDGVLRQPSYQGLRTDLRARSVIHGDAD